MRPHDQHHNHRRDPTSWNLEDKPKDELPPLLLSFAVDEHCKCEKHAQFCVCPTKAVMEKAHTEAAGIEISRGLLWDYRSANARAVLGFMEGHWSALHRIGLTSAARFRIPSAQNEHSHIHGASTMPLSFCNKGYSSFTTNAGLRLSTLKSRNKARC